MRTERKKLTGIIRYAALVLVVAAISLATVGEAEAHHRGRRVVVRPRPHRVVHYYPRPAVVRYVPAYHNACVVRSGYYYLADFGYHRHRYNPGGIYFGVNLVF